MQTKTKERIYLLVIVFCLMMCGVLLISVFIGKPIMAAGEAEQHTPVVRLSQAPLPASAAQNAPQGAEPGGLEITGEYLAQRMSAYLPSGFPGEAVDVSITSDGSFGVGLSMTKSELKDYLKSSGISLGIRQAVAIGFMPDTIEVSAELSCKSADTYGIRLEPKRLSINNKNVDVSFMPQNIFDVLSGAINASIAYSGYDFAGIVFLDGAVLLK